ncbi:MAG: hypothetical protein QNJ51_18785 [Calothrix sp. MO_167.B12]|nr:hypothetical protein [Calothrix sp. MO_167.B12]
MTKIRFKLSPKPSKLQKEKEGKTGFIPQSKVGHFSYQLSVISYQLSVISYPIDKSRGLK